MKLDNKIALISGASRGIGKAIALELGKRGATVIGTATTENGAEKISASFKENNITGTGLVLNVTKQESIDQCLESINKDFGAPSILINNAAINRDNLMLRMKDEEWNEVIDTNLNAIFRLSKACLRSMVKARWGRIISITSVVGLSGNAGQANYGAAKAGLIGFSKSLAQEIATRGITVNCVAPGFIETDMTNALSDEHKKLLLSRVPMGRLGQPEEIAAAVAFLASEEAAYITGETININGGMYMS